MGQRDPVADLMRPDVQKELGITAEQRQKLEDIRFNSEKESIQHNSALRIHRMELSRLTDAENPDRAAIDKKIQEIGQEETAMMRSSINARLNARSLLTAEQRTKLAQLRQSRSQRGRMPGAEGRAPGRPDSSAGQAKDRVASPPAGRDPQPE
ncbi:MAG TPA: periplasmic heavy metal sensor [Acidobacteriota bacterium]|nr:periplasmic heavy metal sensor [Acidobacteriota bacterium]